MQTLINTWGASKCPIPPGLQTKQNSSWLKSFQVWNKKAFWCRDGKPSNILMNHRWQCGCYIGPEGKTIISQSFLEIRNNSQWSLNLCQWDGSARKGCCCQLNDLSTYTKGSPNPCKLSFNLPKHTVICAPTQIHTPQTTVINSKICSFQLGMVVHAFNFNTGGKGRWVSMSSRLA